MRSYLRAFRPCVVQALALTVHGYLHTGFFEQQNVIRIGEMAALVAVDDFRLPNGQGAL